MKKIILLFFFLSAISLRAQVTFSFLRTNKTSKYSSLGSNSASITNDVSSFFDNPATLNASSHLQFQLSYEKYILDINNGSAVIGYDFANVGTFAFGFYYGNAGVFDKYDVFGQPIGSFSADDFLFQIAYSRKLFAFDEVEMYLGITAKYIFSRIDTYASSAVAGDIGVLLNFPTINLQLGMAGLHLGSQLYSYNGVIEKLPYDMRVAIYYTPPHSPLSFNVGWVYLLDTYPNFVERFLNFTLGVDINIMNYVFVRIGYNNRKRLEVDFKSAGFHLGGFGIGVGGKLDRVSLNYNLTFLGTLGLTHSISLGVNFR